MADNEVIITVRSKNDTRAGFDEAKADAEIAGEEAGQGFMAKFGQELATGQLGAGGSGPPGGFFLWGGVAAAAVLLSPLIAGIVNGLVAATAGIGALALVAIPTFEKIKNSYTAVSAAQTAYNTAVEKQKMDPTKANATAVATALLNLKVAQQQAGPGTLTAIASINKLKSSFDAIGQSMQPQIMGIFNTGLGIAAQLMPVVAQFAQAAAPAVQSVMTSLGKSISSAGFKDFVAQFVKITPGAIEAIGSGMGKVAGALGKLFTVMSAHDVVHALNVAFGILAFTINTITGIVSRVMSNWDRMSGAFATAGHNITTFATRAESDLANWAQVVDNIVHNVENWFTVTLPAAAGKAVSWFASMPGKITSALAALPGMLFTAGANAVQRLIDGLMSKIGSVASAAASIASKIAGFFGLSPAKEGPLSGGGAPEIRGAHFTDAYSAGMRSRLAAVAGAAGSVAGTAGGGSGHGGAWEIVLSVDPSFSSAVNELSPGLLRAMRGTVRVKGGGSVQAAFGKAGM
jgi:hypothetical protein